MIRCRKLTLLSAFVLIALVTKNLPGREPEVGGTTKRTAGALIGIFYDFKQDLHRQKIPHPRADCERVLTHFVESGFDEAVMNKYYRVPVPLYTTQIQLDTMDSDYAPKSFGVEKTVEPAHWFVHYKGQIAAPSDGTYRFLGDSDDFLVVGINGKTVLVAQMADTPVHTKWFPKEAATGRYQAAGDWINCRAGEPVDIDIVTGDNPGGQFRSILDVQKKGDRPVPFKISTGTNAPTGAGTWRGIP